MSDTTTTITTPTPVAANHYQEQTLEEKLTQLALSPLGLGLGIPAAIILLAVAFLSFSFFFTGDAADGFAAFLAFVLLCGGVFLLGRFLLKEIHGDASDADAYEAWSTWLEKTYNLKLTDDQNDELVNAIDNPAATMNPDYTWGTTKISRLGRKIDIRLVGNDFQGYTLEMAKGRKFVPLRHR